LRSTEERAGLFVPERKSLVSQEGRDAAYKLLTDIRNADTARELLVYVRGFHSDAAEFRNLLNLIESEITVKIEQFAGEVEAEADRPRIVPDSEERGG
jgi:hypothetical protein